MRRLAHWIAAGGLVLAAAACEEPEKVPVARAQTSERPIRPLVNWEGRRSQEAGQIGDHYQKSGPPFWVRPGFKVTQVASDLGSPRFLERGTGQDIYVSRPRNGDVLTMRLEGDALRPLATFARGYAGVHGLCFADGWLWFTQSGAIHKGRDANRDGVADVVVTVFKEGSLPSGGGHSLRSILVTDRHVFTSIGDPGNITEDQETERKKIWRFDHDGGSKTLFSSGIRNTEKLRLRPGTDEVWGADHGSDNYGVPLGESAGNQPMTDLNPPEEFNHYVEGGFYGHPFFMGQRVPRLEFQNRKDIIDLANMTIPPAWALGAHWAANGFEFYDGSRLPSEFKGDAFVALHGSWNRTVRSGYRIERILFDGVTGRPFGSQMIVGCLGEQGAVLARPVDVTTAHDGSLLFSSDSNGAIYRIDVAKNGRIAQADADKLADAGEVELVVEQLGPVSYFDAKCASCHGPEGSAYGPTFGRGLGEAKLRQVIRQMAAGPGQAPLGGGYLDAQVAYHRAILVKEPFISVATVMNGVARGEASLGSEVTAAVSGRSIPVRRKGYRWTFQLPDGAEASQVSVTARRSGKSTTISLDRPFSHRSPLPAP